MQVAGSRFAGLRLEETHEVLEPAIPRARDPAIEQED